MSNSDEVFRDALSTLLVEVFDGPPGKQAYLLNPGDPGLLRQLASIDADTASSRPMPGKTTIAAHVDHLHYGLVLSNRWMAGDENAFATADWEASWKRGVVTDEEWHALLERLRDESKKWQASVKRRQEWNDIAAAGSMAIAAHTAYHLGAIRQILAAMDKN